MHELTPASSCCSFAYCNNLSIRAEYCSTLASILGLSLLYPNIMLEDITLGKMIERPGDTVGNYVKVTLNVFGPDFCGVLNLLAIK